MVQRVPEIRIREWRSVGLSIAVLGGMVFLLAASAVMAIGHQSRPWAGVVVLFTRGFLAVAFVGAVCTRSQRRAWCLGCFLFGWYSLRTHDHPGYLEHELPTTILLSRLGSAMGVPCEDPVIPGNPEEKLIELFYLIGHQFLALLAAIAGGFLIWAGYVAIARGRQQYGSSPPELPAPAKSWAMPCACTLAAAGLIVLCAIGGAHLATGIWAGTTYLLTWWLLGLAALGAFVGRGERRQFLAGFAGFGIGFWFLSHCQPPFAERESRLHVPTVAFLERVRANLDRLTTSLLGEPDGGAIANSRIRASLERAVPMQFPEGTTLREIIEHVERATRDPDGTPIPIFVDPIGLQEAEKTMESTTLALNLEGVSLATSLFFCLKQFGLTYSIDYEVLMIRSRESLSFRELGRESAAYLVVGHCLLALTVASVGGMATPLVYKLARGR